MYFGCGEYNCQATSSMLLFIRMCPFADKFLIWFLIEFLIIKFNSLFIILIYSLWTTNVRIQMSKSNYDCMSTNITSFGKSHGLSKEKAIFQYIGMIVWKMCLEVRAWRSKKESFEGRMEEKQRQKERAEVQSFIQYHFVNIQREFLFLCQAGCFPVNNYL